MNRAKKVLIAAAVSAFLGSVIGFNLIKKVVIADVFANMSPSNTLLL